MAVGFALANSIMLEGPDGLVIVDTTESEDAAREIMQQFRNISSKPVKAIVYTHFHADHVRGARVGWLYMAAALHWALSIRASN